MQADFMRVDNSVVLVDTSTMKSEKDTGSREKKDNQLDLEQS